MGNRAHAAVAVFSLLVGVVLACSSRDLAGKPSCKNGGGCPAGWGCGADGECTFVGSGGVGGGFGGVSGSGAGNASGFGGSVGGSAGGFLGSACEFDYECPSGLGCMRSDSGLIDAASPAKGICTIDCNAGPATCLGMGGGAQCLTFSSGSSFCMQECFFGPPGAEAFDVAKCHGRPEMACSPVQPGSSNGVCAPRCNADADCKLGWYCHPSDGLCRQDPPLGAGVGEPCSSPDDCRGTCTEIVASGDGQAPLSLCSEQCTHGAPGACGFIEGGGPAAAYCLFGAEGIAPIDGPGAGDLGQCSKLCDCDDQCPSSLGCVPFLPGDPVSLKTERAGYCALAATSIGPCG